MSNNFDLFFFCENYLPWYLFNIIHCVHVKEINERACNKKKEKKGNLCSLDHFNDKLEYTEQKYRGNFYEQ
jgi:hypothetical protein